MSLSWAKMMSLGGKLTALVCHPTKYVSKAEKPTYLSTDIAYWQKLEKAEGKGLTL